MDHTCNHNKWIILVITTNGSYLQSQQMESLNVFKFEQFRLIRLPKYLQNTTASGKTCSEV